MHELYVISLFVKSRFIDLLFPKEETIVTKLHPYQESIVCQNSSLKTQKHIRDSLNKKIQRLLLLLLAPKQIKWQNPVGLSQHWMMDNWSSPIRNQSLMIQYLKSCFGSVYAWMVLFALKAK